MTTKRIIRHTPGDRLFHWTAAIAVLILLATGLLPVLGIDFDWVTIHWIAGIVLTLALLFHIAQVVRKKHLARMRVTPGDIKIWWTKLRGGAARPGKYTLAQKMMHKAMSLTGLTATLTGVVMLFKIDTPLWQRDPYILSDATWGIVYVLHDFSALLFVSLIMLHVYFALRPEKMFYTRSMLRGWIGYDDYVHHHDPSLWPVSQKENADDGR